ncbi:hypothetical protein ACRE_044700 [Hapsidospora chrysogenum ATCC 11550]|uniref:Uncharacterized protein n=1 Tax=Hapsidospora chrysogenum (strain ATCC 11550 / CBS 779.69 / DSM 880 / IAM 14645 / JCM 23072 / IMI 49137) TaxID=857340 RepID=A0A086T5X9_HAPC1|nr:hypothetical protein ACRE_044700 [Hapsidospora chrysogenum ATCC 11550]
MNAGACYRRHDDRASVLCSPLTLTNDEAPLQKHRAIPDTSITTTIIGSAAPEVVGSACPAEPSPNSSPKDNYYSRQPSPASCPASEITAAPKRLVEPADDGYSSKDEDETRHRAASPQPPAPATADAQAAPAHNEPPTPGPYPVQHEAPDVEMLTPMSDADNDDVDEDEDEGYFEGPSTPELMQDANGGMGLLGARWTTSTRLPPFRRSNQVVEGRTRVECSQPRMRRRTRRRRNISMRPRPGTRPPAAQDPPTPWETCGMLVLGANDQLLESVCATPATCAGE